MSHTEVVLIVFAVWIVAYLTGVVQTHLIHAQVGSTFTRVLGATVVMFFVTNGAVELLT